MIHQLTTLWVNHMSTSRPASESVGAKAKAHAAKSMPPPPKAKARPDSRAETHDQPFASPRQPLDPPSSSRQSGKGEARSSRDVFMNDDPTPQQEPIVPNRGRGRGRNQWKGQGRGRGYQQNWYNEGGWGWYRGWP